MSRPVAGLACRVRVPVRQYQAVGLLVGDRGHIVRLVHREAALSIDVESFSSFETAEEYRDRLADFLELPPLTLAGASGARAPEPAAPLPARRRGGIARPRRARFLTRRPTGDIVSIRKIEGREIIARN
jgi:hypothetical protein